MAHNVTAFYSFYNGGLCVTIANVQQVKGVPRIYYNYFILLNDWQNRQEYYKYKNFKVLKILQPYFKHGFCYFQLYALNLKLRMLKVKKIKNIKAVR